MHARIPILIGLCQGLLLLLLHVAVQDKWPLASLPEFAYPAYAAVLLTPVVGMLIFRYGEGMRAGQALAGMATLLLILGFYAGHIAYAEISRSSFGAMFIFGTNMLILAFIAMPFVQSWLRQGGCSFPYADLYEFGWLNTLVLGVACVFTGLVWMLLGLWSALFSMLSISFFSDLFFAKSFAYPATGVMFAYGIALGLQRFHVGLVQKIDFLFRAVMVMVTLIVVLFLLALLVSGLQPLWSTGKATFLLLSLQLFIILFVNGLFQRGDGDREHSALLRWSMALSMLAMPLLSAICIWSLYLRVEQYGWTVDRVWAAMLVAAMSMYAVGYALAAGRSLLRRGSWLSAMAPTNIMTALCIMLLLVLANSPLLSPVVVAANSQVERLLEEKVLARKFDYNYLRFDLGRVGLEKLELLKGVEGHAESDLIRQRARLALARKNRWSNTPADVPVDQASLFKVYPEGRQLDEGLQALLQQKRVEWPFSVCFSGSEECALLFIDMNDDGRDEAVFVEGRRGVLLAEQDGRWRVAGWLEGGMRAGRLADVVKNKKIRVEKSPWKMLSSGRSSWLVVPETPR